MTVVDKVVDKRGTREVATEYLKFLYGDVGQEIAAKHFYRPTKPEIAAMSSAADEGWAQTAWRHHHERQETGSRWPYVAASRG